MTLNAARCALDRERVPSPSGRSVWSKTYLRNCINEDVYLPHTVEEVRALVSPEVAPSLDPSRCCGVWWYGRERHVYVQRRGVPQEGWRKVTLAAWGLPYGRPRKP